MVGVDGRFVYKPEAKDAVCAGATHQFRLLERLVEEADEMLRGSFIRVLAWNPSWDWRKFPQVPRPQERSSAIPAGRAASPSMITTRTAATITTFAFSRSTTVTGMRDGKLGPRDGLDSRAATEAWKALAKFKRHQCSVCHSADVCVGEYEAVCLDS